jgi:hypothetical protein
MLPKTLAVLGVALAVGLGAGWALKPGGVPPAEVDALKSRLSLAQADSGRWSALTAEYSDYVPAAMDEHLIKDNGDGTSFFIHFDGPAKEKPLFIGHGVWGNACKTAQDKINAANGGGYTHFHTTKTPGVPDQHGFPSSKKGSEVQGWWFKHVALTDIDDPLMNGMIGGPLTAGQVATAFMPTPADPGC